MKKEIVEDIDLEDNDQDEEVIIDLKQTRNYVDNERLLNDFIWYITELGKYNNGEIETQPRMTEYMGECFIKIANGYSNHHLFRNYTNAWKEEMIEEGIEACVRYSKSFDINKYDNPFTYITYIVHTAFLKRIKLEKKQQYKKYKFLIHNNGYMAFDDNVTVEDNLNADNEVSDQFKTALEFVETYENSKMFPGNKKKAKKKVKNDKNVFED